MTFVRFVVLFGPTLAWLVLALAVVLVVTAARRGRGFAPRGLLGWSAWALALVLGAASSSFLLWSQTKVTPLVSLFHQAGAPAATLVFRGVEDGRPHALADYRGKVVVLNFWATWCPPCRAEMPDLDRLQREYGAEGLVVIMVSDEPAERLQKVPGFSGLSVVKGIVDPATADPALFVQARVARPVTHIIDRDGVLRQTLIEGESFAGFQRLVTPLLKGRG